MLIQPFQKDETFLADVESAAMEDGRSNHFQLWWLGQSGFLLQWQGSRILLDPYLSDSLTRKYDGTEKPHVRMTERVVDPALLKNILVTTSSHNHTDHLDQETLLPLWESNPHMKILAPEANRQFVADRLKVDPGKLFGAVQGQAIHLEGFTFHPVPAAHEELDADEQGRYRYLGYVIQFGGWTVYHSGDTLLFDGMEAILRRWPIDVAILPINGRKPERKVAGNLDGPQAAQLAREIGAKTVIPCHYEMFEFNTATPESFELKASELGQNFHTLQAGERWTSRSIRIV